MTIFPNPVFDILNELSTCLCAAIAEAELPGLCFCGVVPGEAAALDYGSDCEACGMAWVRLGTAYPSTIIGEPSPLPGNCGNALGIEVELGIVRCAPMIREGGILPTETQQRLAVSLQMADMMAMRRAVACCRESKDWVLGGYLPLGPEGGVVGGTWTVAIQVM